MYIYIFENTGIEKEEGTIWLEERPGGPVRIRTGFGKSDRKGTRS